MGVSRRAFPASRDVGIRASRAGPSGLLFPASLSCLHKPARATGALCTAHSKHMHHLEHYKVLQACPVAILGRTYRYRNRNFGGNGWATLAEPLFTSIVRHEKEPQGKKFPTQLRSDQLQSNCTHNQNIGRRKVISNRSPQ